MLIAFIVTSTFVNLFLFIIWGKSTWLNVFLKVVFFAMTVWGTALGLAHLAPLIDTGTTRLL
jgi:hypothetical protein